MLCYFSLRASQVIRCGMVAGVVLLLSVCSLVNAQTLSPNIRLNQIGFYPDAPKIAVIAAEAGTAFYLTSPDLQDTVFTGKLSEPRKSAFSNKQTRIADFSDFKTRGTYVVYIPGVGYSYQFSIRPHVHADVARASLKGFYYIRASISLPVEYAGVWSRPAGHPDNQVAIHSSAASPQRPTGTIISSPGGWYDAGDYNKYIVNSGITVGTLLSLYEDFPAFCDTMSVNIPESSNRLPDLLDETLWNLRWMLTMQDPNDGGVYHKLTNAKFDGMIMPAQAQATRYVVQKSTTAALDFAAVMAQASRIFRKFPNEVPGLADSCLVAATRAWDWAKKNPAVLYRQDEMNKLHDPDVTTGAYGDQDPGDEFIWAAAELYVTTKKDSYYKAVKFFPDEKMPLPSWSQVRLLGYYTLARFENELTPVAKKDLPVLKKRLIDFASNLAAGTSERAYMTVMGGSEKDFIWGSSAVAANQGIALIQAYRLSGDAQFLKYALSNMDYLLGRNATGYSFVTGCGDKTPMHPHHRPSEADGIREPIPGLLSGGPNANAPRQDKCTTYTSNVTDEVFTDDVCSYASNEIAINWNAPLVYLAGALEALQYKAGYSAMKK